MAEDFKYRRRSEEEWNRRQQGTSNFEGYVLDEYSVLRTKKGENQIRIYPPTWDRADHFGYTVWVHYGVGPDRASVICPQKMLNEPCPICEERVRVQRRGDEEEAKQLRAHQRVVCWAENKKEDKGLQVWGMPGTLDTDICRRCKDRETGALCDIDDPDEGFDVFFDVEGEGQRTRYVSVELSRKPNRVPAKNLDYIQDHPIPKTLRWRDYDEILKLFEGGPGRSGSARDADRGRDRDDDDRGRERESSRSSSRERESGSDRGRERESSRERDDGRSRSRDDADDRRSSRDDDRRSSSRERDDDRGRGRDEERRNTREPDPDTRAARDREVDDRPARSSRSNGHDDVDPPFDRAERTTGRRQLRREEPREERGSSRDEDARPSRDDDRGSAPRGGDRARELQERFAKRD